jgi:hypothetical protein
VSGEVQFGDGAKDVPARGPEQHPGPGLPHRRRLAGTVNAGT